MNRGIKALTGAVVMLAATLGEAPQANGAPLDPAAPESVGMSSARLAALKARMTEFVASGERAGIVYAVARDGKLVALEAIGQRDLERKLPMEPETAFRIYSQSRALTAAATLTLLDEGRLRLADPVARYIPEIGTMRVLREGSTSETEPQRQPMSVLHLFTYTAGLGYATDWPKALGVKQSDILDIDRTLADGMRNLARLPLLTQPGAKWRYGFAGDVLGRVAEVASGQPLDAFLNARLFEPLGMRNTGFWISPAQLARGDLAKVYTPGKDGKLEDMSERATPLSTYTRPGPLFSGGGGLVSTVPDYLRFAQMLLDRGELGGVRVLRKETVDAMLKRQTSAEQGDVYWYAPDAFPTVKGFGWGLSIGVRPDDAGAEVPGRPGEKGWAGLANTLFFINTRERIAAVAMAQYVGPDAGALNFAFRDGVYAALEKKGTDLFSSPRK
jgi:CubicO group peptidase (beta-lactamase class C family)